MEGKSKSDKSPETAILNARRQITRSVLLALAALAVIVFACFAWFVSTKDVTGSLGAVRLTGSKFELASAGGEGAYDEILPEEWNVTGDTWKSGDLSGTQTGRQSAILWRLTDESNLNNQSGKDTVGIQPGSHGKLQFYVIPQSSEELHLQFHLELIPLGQNDDGSLYEISSDATLRQLLLGHLLFYQEDNSQKAWVDCRTGSFELNFTGCEEDQPILVTLNWTWPYLLEHVKDQTDVVEWMGESSNYFFYNDGAEIPTVDLDNQYSIFDRLFNNADDYIGTHTAGVFLRLTAQIV